MHRDDIAQLAKYAAARTPVPPHIDLVAGLGMAAAVLEKQAAGVDLQGLARKYMPRVLGYAQKRLPRIFGQAPGADMIQRMAPSLTPSITPGGSWFSRLWSRANRPIPGTPPVIPPSVGAAVDATAGAVGSVASALPSAAAATGRAGASALGGGANLLHHVGQHPYRYAFGGLGAGQVGYGIYDRVRGDPADAGGPITSYRAHAGEWNQQTGALRAQIEQALNTGDTAKAHQLTQQLEAGNFGGSSGVGSILRPLLRPLTFGAVDRAEGGVAHHRQRMDAMRAQMQTQYDKAMERYAGIPSQDRSMLAGLRQQLTSQGRDMPPAQRQLIERQAAALEARLRAPRAGESAEATALAVQMRGAGMQVRPYNVQGTDQPQASGLPVGYVPPGHGWGLPPSGGVAGDVYAQQRHINRGALNYLDGLGSSPGPGHLPYYLQQQQQHLPEGPVTR